MGTFQWFLNGKKKKVKFLSGFTQWYLPHEFVTSAKTEDALAWNVFPIFSKHLNPVHPKHYRGAFLNFPIRGNLILSSFHSMFASMFSINFILAVLFPSCLPHEITNFSTASSSLYSSQGPWCNACCLAGGGLLEEETDEQIHAILLPVRLKPTVDQPPEQEETLQRSELDTWCFRIIST